MKNKIIIIAGPTATGKTKTSIALAKKINGEIISADSMLVYKHMNIGTAKPTEIEKDGITHYMIDKYLPDYRFSIAKFKEDVYKYINFIYKKGKVPILVGGTGFYINAIIYNTDFSQNTTNLPYREKLENLVSIKGKDYLHNMLKSVDIESALKIPVNNVKKVIRALEFYEVSGIPISKHNKNEKSRMPYFDAKIFILNIEREVLYSRINKRVDDMIKSGLINEVSSLLEKGYTKSMTSMKGIGYKEIIEYIDGNITKIEAIELIKKNTRNFAKRQITWFKHQSDGIWLDTMDCSNKSLVDKIIIELNK